jgi:hypothetical protein
MGGPNLERNDKSSSQPNLSGRNFGLTVWTVVLWLIFFEGNTSRAATNTISLNYPDRNALLADGWTFTAITNGVARDTEITDTNIGPVISYAQTNSSLAMLSHSSSKAPLAAGLPVAAALSVVPFTLPKIELIPSLTFLPLAPATDPPAAAAPNSVMVCPQAAPARIVTPSTETSVKNRIDGTSILESNKRFIARK